MTRQRLGFGQLVKCWKTWDLGPKWPERAVARCATARAGKQYTVYFPRKYSRCARRGAATAVIACNVSEQHCTVCRCTTIQGEIWWKMNIFGKKTQLLWQIGLTFLYCAVASRGGRVRRTDTFVGCAYIVEQCGELWRLFLRNPNTNPSNATIVFDERGGGMSKKMRRTCEVERAACSKTR